MPMVFQLQLVQGNPNPELALENMLAEWGGIACSQLSVLLVHLRLAYFVHQTHHWVAKGDPFYGDHLLFERLYTDILEEIDAVAEKSVGMGSEANVNLMLQCSQVARLANAYGLTQAVPQATDLVRMSLLVEENFLKVLGQLCHSMQEQGVETPGVENMLQQIADKHESHVYLLRRRSMSPALGM